MLILSLSCENGEKKGYVEAWKKFRRPGLSRITLARLGEEHENKERNLFLQKRHLSAVYLSNTSKTST